MRDHLLVWNVHIFHSSLQPVHLRNKKKQKVLIDGMLLYSTVHVLQDGSKHERNKHLLLNRIINLTIVSRISCANLRVHHKQQKMKRFCLLPVPKWLLMHLPYLSFVSSSNCYLIILLLID